MSVVVSFGNGSLFAVPTPHRPRTGPQGPIEVQICRRVKDPFGRRLSEPDREPDHRTGRNDPCDVRLARLCFEVAEVQEPVGARIPQARGSDNDRRHVGCRRFQLLRGIDCRGCVVQVIRDRCLRRRRARQQTREGDSQSEGSSTKAHAGLLSARAVCAIARTQKCSRAAPRSNPRASACAGETTPGSRCATQCLSRGRSLARIRTRPMKPIEKS